MKFKKYIKESCEQPVINLEEGFTNPDAIFTEYHPADDFYADIKKAIADGRFEDARAELDELEQEIAEIEASNAKKKIFKFPKFILDGQKRAIAQFRSQLPMEESIEDMNKRCEKCNTLLSDAGMCPKCDDGEEDYEDKKDTIEEELSNKQKLLRAYPELNFDKAEPVEEIVTEEVVHEDLSNKEKLKRAFPELNFDNDSNERIEETFDPEYDDEYDIEDDVEMDRRHAALYGGDRMYCSCGKKLHFNEYGSYCPDCEPETAADEHFRLVDDDVEEGFLFSSEDINKD